MMMMDGWCEDDHRAARIRHTVDTHTATPFCTLIDDGVREILYQLRHRHSHMI